MNESSHVICDDEVTEIYYLNKFEQILKVDFFINRQSVVFVDNMIVFNLVV